MSQQTVVTITHNAESNYDITSTLKNPSDRPRHQAEALARFLEAVSGGLRTASMTVKVQTDDAVAASATATFASAANNDTITVGAVTLTGVTGTPGAGQFKVGVSNNADAAAYAAAVNAHATLSKFVSASAVSAVVTITALAKGVVGNSMPFTSSNGVRLAVTGSGFLASGAEPTTADYSPNTYSYGK